MQENFFTGNKLGVKRGEVIKSFIKYILIE